MNQTMEDADAIRLSRTGLPAAFQHLVHRHQRRALVHARALTGNDADAADATQDAFFDAFRNLDRFDLQHEFYPWFYVLLRHRCFKQRTRHGTKLESGPLPERQGAQGIAAEDGLHLRAALDRLDPADRELIVLKHLDGWTYQELAMRLDIPAGTVMSRLFDARRRLQHLLTGAEL